MNKKLVVAIFATLLCASAYADVNGEGNNTGCNGVGNSNSPCGGTNATTNNSGGGGGLGGAGGQGGAGGVGGAGGLGGAGGSSSAGASATGGAGGSAAGGSSSAAGGSATGGNAAGGNAAVTGSVTSTQTAQGGSASAAQKVENVGNGTSNVVVQGDAAQARNPVSTAFAPTIVTGSDQCLVPVSAGGQAVTFGISIGTAVPDAICEALKLSRELRSMGFNAEALKLLKAADPRVAAAFQ